MSLTFNFNTVSNVKTKIDLKHRNIYTLLICNLCINQLCRK